MLKSFIVFISLFLALGCGTTERIADPPTVPDDNQHWVDYTEISWYDDPYDAYISAAQHHKPMFVYLYANWCEWCKKMEKETLTDRVVIVIVNDNFVALKIDVESDVGALVLKGREIKIPTIVIGYADPDRFYMTKAVEITGFASTGRLVDEIKRSGIIHE